MNDHFNKLYHLLGVCRAWREFAQGCPTLWAVASSENSEDVTARAVAISNSTPIDIDFAVYAKEGPSYQGTPYDNFFDDLLPECGRCRFFRFRTAGPFVRHTVEDAIGRLQEVNLPHVTKLHLLSDVEISVKRVMWDPARLRHLRLCRVSVPWSPTIIYNLSTLDLELNAFAFPPFKDLHDILVACPRLRELRLQQRGAWDTDRRLRLWAPELPRDIVPAQLDHLDHLSLRLSFTVTRHILVNLRLPNCKSFSLSCFDTDVHRRALDKRQLSHLIGPIRAILVRSQYRTMTLHRNVLRMRAGLVAEKGERFQMEIDRNRPYHGEVEASAMTWIIDILKSIRPRRTLHLKVSYFPGNMARILPLVQTSYPITSLTFIHPYKGLPVPAEYRALLVEPFRDKLGTLQWPLPHLHTIRFEGRPFEHGCLLDILRRRYALGPVDGEGEERPADRPAALTLLKFTHLADQSSAIKRAGEGQEVLSDGNEREDHVLNAQESWEGQAFREIEGIIGHGKLQWLFARHGETALRPTEPLITQSA